MEAQRYPADFEGIVVGAPANNWTRLLTSGVWNWKALTETQGSPPLLPNSRRCSTRPTPTSAPFVIGAGK